MENGRPLRASTNRAPICFSTHYKAHTNHAFSELTVKVVQVENMTNVLYLREQSKAVKHVSFDPTGNLLTVSCSDGLIYIYSIEHGEAELIHRLDGVIKSLETDVEAASKAIWHPDGRAFACPTAVKGSFVPLLASPTSMGHESTIPIQLVS